MSSLPQIRDEAGAVARLQKRGYLFGAPRSSVLITGGMARDWPDARGVFCTRNQPDEPTLVCWVNEEDHLRIMSLADGADVHAAFKSFAEVPTHFLSCDE